MGVVVLLAFFEALTYQLVSARTPFVIMAPLFVLIVVQGVRLYRQRHEADLGRRLRMAVSGRMSGLNRAVALILWLVALLLLVYVGGILLSPVVPNTWMRGSKAMELAAAIWPVLQKNLEERGMEIPDSADLSTPGAAQSPLQ